MKYIRLRTETSKNFSEQGTVCSGSKMRVISSPINRLRFLNTLVHGVSYSYVVDSSWNVMVHDDAREGKWRGNWWMEWVVSTLHTTSEHGVSSITTADAHTSAASNWLKKRPRLVRFAERRNLVSARLPSHFNWPLTTHRSLVFSVCRQRQALGMAQSPTSEVKGSQLTADH